MRTILLFTFLLLSSTLISQDDFNDTLYYKSGMVRVCKITDDHDNMVKFIYINQKSKEVKSSVAKNKLTHYSFGSDTTNSSGGNNSVAIVNQQVVKYDSIEFSTSNFSINPFSPFMLGINFVYDYTFLEHPSFGLHFPFRLFTLYGLSPVVITTGIGGTYNAYLNPNATFTTGINLHFILAGDIQLFGPVFRLGGRNQLNDVLNLNYYVGIGPNFIQPETGRIPLLFDGHIGLGFKFGKRSFFKL